jgi:hypothetical protein
VALYGGQTIERYEEPTDRRQTKKRLPEFHFHQW